LNKKLEEIVTQYQRSAIEAQKNKITYRHLNENYVRMVEEHKDLIEKSKTDGRTLHQLALGNENLKAQLFILEKLAEKADSTLRHFTDKNLFLMQEKTALQSQLEQVLATK